MQQIRPGLRHHRHLRAGALCRIRPNRLSVSTLNSRTASIPSSCPLTPPGVMASWLDPVYSIPFSSTILSEGRRPSTENV